MTGRTGRHGRDRGQAMVEFALILPLISFLILAVFQFGMLGYASVIARYAAFHGVRAAAVQDDKDREDTAKKHAKDAVSAAPIVRLVSMEVEEVTSGFESGKDTTRLSMTVRLRVPRLLPKQWLSEIEGSCVAPMEPVDWED